MPVFLIIAIVGALFLFISAFSGGDHDGGDHDFDGDHDHDMGHDGDSDGDVGPSPFSMRIIAIFLTSFGSCGAIARFYNLSYMLSSGTGVVGGLFIAFLAFQLLKFFYHQQASSTISTSDMLGAVAEVKIEIPSSGLGQVSLIVKNQRVYYPARTSDGTKIPVGSSVKIIECPGDSVIVQKV